MKIIDLNVLLYAVNSDAQHHQRVREWWEAAVNAEETVGLPWRVLTGFLRLAAFQRAAPREPDRSGSVGGLSGGQFMLLTFVVARQDGRCQFR